MKIVKLDKNNIKLVAKLRAGLYDHLEKELKLYSEPTNFDYQYHIVQLRKFSKRKETVILVGKEGDEIMAYSMGHVYVDDYDNEKYGYLDEVFIAKEFRGKRLAGNLFTAMTNEFAKFNIKGVFTEVSTRNPASLKAHKRIGFKTVDTTELLFKKR